MVRKINLLLEDGTIFQGSFQKFTKQDLYGKKRIIKETEDETELHSVTITKDGTTILPNGAISSQYIDPKGNYVPKSDLIQTDEEGNPLQIVESMFSQDNRLEIIHFEDLMRYDIIRTYILEVEDFNNDLFSRCQELFENDELYKFQYAYRKTTHPHDALLLPKNNQLFVLIGDYAPLEWTTAEIDLDWYQKLADEQDTIDFEEYW